MTPTLEDVEERVDKLETCTSTLEEKVNQLIGQNSTTLMILKYVVIPLLIIVGGLVGVKIAFPTA